MYMHSGPNRSAIDFKEHKEYPSTKCIHTLLAVMSLMGGEGLLLSKSTRHALSKMYLPSLYFCDLSYALMYFQPTYDMHSRQ